MLFSSSNRSFCSSLHYCFPLVISLRISWDEPLIKSDDNHCDKPAFALLVPQWFAAFLLIPHMYREVGTLYERAYTSSHCPGDQKPLRKTNLSVNLANLLGKAQHVPSFSRHVGG